VCSKPISGFASLCVWRGDVWERARKGESFNDDFSRSRASLKNLKVAASLQMIGGAWGIHKYQNTDKKFQIILFEFLPFQVRKRLLSSNLIQPINFRIMRSSRSRYKQNVMFHFSVTFLSHFSVLSVDPQSPSRFCCHFSLHLWKKEAMVMLCYDCARGGAMYELLTSLARTGRNRK
jgi:hypothetical protein